MPKKHNRQVSRSPNPLLRAVLPVLRKIIVVTQKQITCALMKNETKERCKSYINLTKSSESNTPNAAKHIVAAKHIIGNHPSATMTSIIYQNEDILPNDGQRKKETHKNKNKKK
ncbi:hypothetical protein JTB14_002797 [Gonioctena quinquepunctata]|nr:hypothetical protein JTB14_002797 [Gonioctena quinquepunctata]